MFHKNQFCDEKCIIITKYNLELWKLFDIFSCCVSYTFSYFSFSDASSQQRAVGEHVVFKPKKVCSFIFTLHVSVFNK